MIGLTADVIAGAIVGFWNAKKVGEQLRLQVSLIWSFWLSASFSCGTALVNHASYASAIGTGLIVGSSMAAVLWRVSPLTRGMQLALPAAEAGKEIDLDKQIVTK